MEEIFFDQLEQLKGDEEPLKRIKIVPKKDGVYFFVDDFEIAKIGNIGTVVYEGNVMISSKNLTTSFTALLMDICSRAYGKPVKMKTVCEPPINPCTALDYAKYIHVPHISTAFEYDGKMLFVFIDVLYDKKGALLYYVSLYLLNNNFISFIFPKLSVKNELIPSSALKFVVRMAMAEVNDEKFTDEQDAIIIINNHCKGIKDKFISAGINPYEIFKYLSERPF
ncbi:MAG: hypothetical protein ABIK73_07645 [candidate division WOR-3 bacterium]